MFSSNRRKALATALAGAALASAVGTSGAAADEYVDLRSPDAREAASDPAPVPQSGPYPVAEDYGKLRAPAAQGAGEPYTDLRMPDSRQPQSPVATPATQPVADEPSTLGAFDWLSAALGAAAGAGLVLILLAAGTGSGRLRHPRPVNQGTVGS